jgi:hydrogenase expression/formation protein HypC
MCLAVPAKIVKIIDEKKATVDIQGIMQDTNISLVEVDVGDWVLIHAGVVINKIDEESAKETLAIFDELEVKLNESK